MGNSGLVRAIRSSIDYARDFLKENPKPSRKEAIDMLKDVLDDVEWCINNLVKDEDIAILKEIDTFFKQRYDFLFYSIFWQGVFNAKDRVSKWKQTIQNTIRNLEKRDWEVMWYSKPSINSGVYDKYQITCSKRV